MKPNQKFWNKLETFQKLWTHSISFQYHMFHQYHMTLKSSTNNQKPTVWWIDQFKPTPIWNRVSKSFIFQALPRFVPERNPSDVQPYQPKHWTSILSTTCWWSNVMKIAQNQSVQQVTLPATRQATCPGYVSSSYVSSTKRSNDFGSIFPKTRLKQIKI